MNNFQIGTIPDNLGINHKIKTPDSWGFSTESGWCVFIDRVAKGFKKQSNNFKCNYVSCKCIKEPEVFIIRKINELVLHELLHFVGRLNHEFSVDDLDLEDISVLIQKYKEYIKNMKFREKRRFDIINNKPEDTPKLSGVVIFRVDAPKEKIYKTMQTLKNRVMVWKSIFGDEIDKVSKILTLNENEEQKNEQRKV